MTPSPPPGPRSAGASAEPAAARAGFLAWLVAITAAAAALRLRHLGQEILRDDELHVLAAVTTRTLAQLPQTVRDTDFGIPLAMLYRALAAWRPLDEWTLRAPMLLCGSLAPALAAGLARRFVSRRVALLLALLVAVHPLFIFYSRFVRTYSICLVLILGAAWLLDRWATERRRGPLLGAALCAALACWFQALAVIPVALLYAGALLAELLPRRAGSGPRASAAPGADAAAGVVGLPGADSADGAPVAPRAAGRPLALLLGGALALLLALACYGPALPELVGKLVVGKVGHGSLDGSVLARNAAVLAGMPGLLAPAVLAALALTGFVLLARRVGRRALPLLLAALGQPLVILALQPEGLGGTFVLARYQFYALPLWLLAAAVALAALAAGLAARVVSPAGAPVGSSPAAALGPARDVTARLSRLHASGPLLAAALAGAWLWWGPYRAIYTEENACAHHVAFQTLGFLDDPGFAAARARAPDAPLHSFYKELPASADPVPLVVEWPAPPDDPHDALYLAQAFHRLPMKLLASPGEIWWTSPLLALRNVITLHDGEPSPFPPGTLVVLHRNPIVELATFVYRRNYWQPPDSHHAQAFQAMSETLRALLGPPVLDDRYLMVFRQPPR